MKAARKRTKHEILAGVEDWLDNHCGIMIIESRPNGVRKMWVETVYIKDEIPEKFLDVLRAVIRETGAMKSQITIGPDGDVKTLHVSKEF